ncbi:MAG: class II aldolase/adducin family protein [Actinomycetota bacterium]|jgi:ribulose-5-phosphate 4-epimerase/fuculose-1-phosphate aldolase|nr:class II aldolase/adducin family protein [Actinomycetota bacterium]MEE2957668.1 class II aldolase/adducin family protein [Actinomycetota bacterium]
MTTLETPTVSGEVDEAQIRVDLAAAFRLAARFDLHESVANHFSAAVSPDGKRFLCNPKWRHFSLVRASELILLDADDPSTMDRPDAPDPSAWCIHGAIHARIPTARAVLHCHPPHAAALCGLADPTIPPLDQATARFWGRTVYDMEISGPPDDPAEGARVAEALVGNSVMMMGNHGVTVVGETVAHAFEELYYLERACRTVVIALSTGRELRPMDDELAASVVRMWERFADQGVAHFAELKAVLDAEDPSYRD